MAISDDGISDGGKGKKRRRRKEAGGDGDDAAAAGEAPDVVEKEVRRKKAQAPKVSEKEQSRAALLEDELFGRPSFAVDEDDAEEKTTSSLEDSSQPLFVIDAEGDRGVGDEEDGEGAEERTTGALVDARGARKPAWVDDGEEDVVVSIVGESRRRKLRKDVSEVEVGGEVFQDRLREKYRELNSKNQSWASLPADRDGEAEGEADAILRQTVSLIAPSSSVLPPQIIEATRVKDANHAEPSACVLQSIDFHPTSLLMLTAGFDKMLRLYDIDGVRNPKVRAAYFEDLPIRQAAFVDSAHVLCAGRRPFCYKFDVETGAIEKISNVSGFERSSLETFAASRALRCAAFLGRTGEIALVSTKTNRKVADLRANDRATCAAFAGEGERELVATTARGEVTKWDLRMMRCVDRFVDEGNLKATAIAVSAPSAASSSVPAYSAIGSESGVVNVYVGGLRSDTKPKRSVMNLTTKVDTLALDGSGSLLAMASSMKRDALRLVHLPTCTVFSNWPTFKTPLHYVHACAFSPGTGYLAVGNARGRCLLYRLPHFGGK